ncbi:hypothetical protein CUZ56_00610 [Saezia sanguinis]|mgnify:CR=1 FL=1|jgi:hypothetical protein|uniref:Uncharacterized protein n=1 Tax=Saezia sanguinis TaxID=1965230 RepID=A0A433SHA3_9BURK|nr:hypothetical protein [Saezia sanguinis]RUS68125.1 hypothetical protein CUZ56_00610 [Saezia sanguinis]
MNIIVYALLCYGITAVISFFLIALIILINKIMSRSSTSEQAEEGV